MDFDKIFPKVTNEFGYWLAGFTDGEGCFSIQISSGCYTYQLKFQINLRSDDIAILEKIRETMGIGRIISRTSGYTRELRDGKIYKQQPQSTYYVTRKGELPRIVSFFERYPLQTKKQHDFSVWSIAVKEHTRSDYRPSKLRFYMESLKSIRKYNADEEIMEELPDPQLLLAISKSKKGEYR